jgi:hypothetical protein
MHKMRGAGDLLAGGATLPRESGLTRMDMAAGSPCPLSSQSCAPSQDSIIRWGGGSLAISPGLPSFGTGAPGFASLPGTPASRESTVGPSKARPVC